MISLTVIPESTKVPIEVPAEYANKKLHVEKREEGRSERFTFVSALSYL